MPAEVSKQKLPLSTSRDAPRFTHTQPSEVRRFIQKMESLFKAAGINDDEERKERVTEYVDAETDSEWRGLDSFSDGSSWETFVKEVQSSYPEAISEEGSVAMLDKICKEHARLSQNDTEEIHALVRKFRAEAKKLTGVLGNGALVEKFTKCFTPAFRELILAQALQKYGHYSDVNRKRHKDDRFDLKEVINIVAILVDSGTSFRSEETIKERGPGMIKVKQEADLETEGRLANLQDGVMALGKEMSSLRGFMQTMNNEWKAKSQTPVQGGLQNRIGVPAQTLQTMQFQGNSNTAAGINCYHCWELGHRTNDCGYLKTQLQEGKLILFEGRPRLPSGDPIPRSPPNVPPKERVNTIMDPKAAAFYGWVEEPLVTMPSVATYVQAVPKEKEDLEKKIEELQNLVSSLITTRSQVYERGTQQQKQEGF
ncbi:hypothetical protein H2248_012227 [Termitomyces sp. 'cryptogamus']|nr:hypothetical protein H2248_012227 [Termitomyces sp. 'cryptogamus']